MANHPLVGTAVYSSHIFRKSPNPGDKGIVTEASKTFGDRWTFRIEFPEGHTMLASPREETYPHLWWEAIDG